MEIVKSKDTNLECNDYEISEKNGKAFEVSIRVKEKELVSAKNVEIVFVDAINTYISIKGNAINSVASFNIPTDEIEKITFRLNLLSIYFKEDGDD